MKKRNQHRVGNVALALSVLTFLVYFFNVLLGGPLGRKPMISDVQEMLTLFVAVTFFVIGTLSREAEAKADRSGDAPQERQGPS